MPPTWGAQAMTQQQIRALVWGSVLSLVAGAIGVGVYLYDPVIKTTHYPDRARLVNTTVGCNKGPGGVLQVRHWHGVR